MIKDKVIGSGKSKRVSKSQWESRIRKNGQGCPRRNKWDKGAYKQCNKKKPKIVWVWI